ncbi:MAG: lysophospholipid acyltransferase family protein [Candidatus Moraniibacteriota bacterium]|jgi:hypothetical protein
MNESKFRIQEKTNNTDRETFEKSEAKEMQCETENTEIYIKKDAEKIGELHEQIALIDKMEDENIIKKKREEKIFSYIEKNLPDYIEIQKPSTVYKIFKLISKLALKDVYGKEQLSDNPKLFIANHRGGETGRLIAALEDPVHIVSAETINWDNDKIGAFKWLMKKLGMVSVRETFSNLDDKQQEKVVKKSRVSEREAHEKVKEGVDGLGGGNIKNIKSMVALLLSGENVAIFTEGPFSRIEEDDRRSYAGYALVAREYKRVTGETLDIVPTGIRNSKVIFDKSIHIDENGRQSKEELQDLATQKIHALYNSLG